MSDLAALARARLDEEERYALMASPEPWVAYEHPLREYDHQRGHDVWIVATEPDDGGPVRLVADTGQHVKAAANAAHIARQDPRTTLARVAALRELVEWATADYRELSPDSDVPLANIATSDAQETVMDVLARMLGVENA